MEDTTTKKEEETTTKTTPPMPPLEAAAWRLDRLLGGGLSDKERQLFTYSNPTKVVRRWLGTASGASGKATSADIGAAAKKLLDPKAEGRTLLLSVCDDDNTTMDIEDDSPSSAEETKKYLGTASSREVEAWLLSLQVRIFWKDGKFMDAMDLVQKSISIVLVHLDFDAEYAAAASGAPSSSLFPLLARLYRYRSLVADALKDPAITSSLRQEMARAHNMACLRRDFDSQATLLNQMLRDLLQHSQSKSTRWRVEFVRFFVCPNIFLTYNLLNHRIPQLNKHINFFLMLHSQNQHRTMNFVDTCIIVDGSKHCV